MTDKKYADVCRENINRAKQEEEQKNMEAAAERTRKFEAAKKRLADGEMDIVFAEWLKKIDEASKEQKRETTISLAMNMGDNHSLDPYNEALVEMGRKRLEDEGFKVKYYSKWRPTFGSDDPYGNHTYIGFEVSW